VDNVHRIMASQSDLKAACETIEAYQAELDNDLAALSENLDLELEALQLQVRVSVRCVSMRVCCGEHNSGSWEEHALCDYSGCIYTPMCTVLRVACVYVAIRSIAMFEQRAVHFTFPCLPHRKY
jgi:hypothetical protein